MPVNYFTTTVNNLSIEIPAFDIDFINKPIYIKGKSEKIV